jgi:hypothetical protein
MKSALTDRLWTAEDFGPEVAQKFLARNEVGRVLNAQTGMVVVPTETVFSESQEVASVLFPNPQSTMERDFIQVTLPVYGPGEAFLYVQRLFGPARRVAGWFVLVSEAAGPWSVRSAYRIFDTHSELSD